MYLIGTNSPPCWNYGLIFFQSRKNSTIQEKRKYIVINKKNYIKKITNFNYID